MKHRHERTLWHLTHGQRLRYASAMLAMGLGHLALLQIPWISGVAIDAFVEGNPGAGPGWIRALAGGTGVHPLWICAAALVLATAIGGVFHYLRARGAAIASQAIVRRLRDRLYSHLGDLPRTYHDGAETGDLVQRCSSDVETVRVFLEGQVVEIGRASLLLLVVIPLMLALDARMTLVAVALFPVIFAFAMGFFRKVRRLFTAVDEAEGRMTSVLQENLTGIRVVRAFARQEYEEEKFGKENAEFRDRSCDLMNVLANYWSISDFLCFVQIALVLFTGAAFMLAGELTVGTLFAFLMYVSLVIWPLRHMGRVLADTGKALVSLGRIREILTVAPESDLAGSNGTEPAALRGAIRVEGLDFAFRPGEPVLADIDFEVEPGETVALIGPPGSGKSVLVQLLLRLYDYEEGSIRLDGHELSTLGRRFVRSRIGAVLQEPFLYSKTIEENLRVARGDAGDGEIRRAARDADVHDAIVRFDDGYSTLLGERGVTLSGGQRQRVALARALLKDPDILVLDDALSAVDTKTETRILDALDRRHGSRTTILIAHRLSSIAAADRILVLERGRIVSAGTHEELIREAGPYRRLWRIQGALEDEIGEAAGRPGGER